jgi:hypothetical protein
MLFWLSLSLCAHFDDTRGPSERKRCQVRPRDGTLKGGKAFWIPEDGV